MFSLAVQTGVQLGVRAGSTVGSTGGNTGGSIGGNAEEITEEIRPSLAGFGLHLELRLVVRSDTIYGDPLETLQGAGRGVSCGVSFVLLSAVSDCRVTTPMPRTPRECYFLS